MDSLNHLKIRDSRNTHFPTVAYKGKNLVSVDVKTSNPSVTCLYRKLPTKMNCSRTCGERFYGERRISNETICVCVLCSIPQLTPKDDNSTNSTKTLYVEREQHKSTITYSLILAGFSLFALLTNFFVLSKICSCHGLTVIKIFGMSLMIFNVLLAEYGIAVAAYLSQEDYQWDTLFCSGLSSLKLFALNAVTFTLTLMIFHKSINPADGTLEKRQVRFKAIVYILEGLMFSGMAAVISWVKFSNWEYLCSVWTLRATVDKLLTGIEATPHVALILLWLKHLYRGAKRLKSTGHCEDKVELEMSSEREHPIFFLVLFTSIIWSVPYVLTSNFLDLVSERPSALIRTCAYLTGAAFQPLLFIIRNKWICNICCETQVINTEEEALVCECKGMQMCKGCEQDMSRILEKCGDHYKFEDRRKSMSLDNLSLSLPRKKNLIAHPNVKKCNGVSNSFPLLSTPIYEESSTEDQEEEARQTFAFALSKFLQDRLPESLTSHGTPRKKKISTCSRLRDSYSSLPLLSNGSPKSTPQRKASHHRVTFRSVHNTPVKNAVIRKDQEAETSLINGDEIDNSSGCNLETEGLLDEFHKNGQGNNIGTQAPASKFSCNNSIGVDTKIKSVNAKTCSDQSIAEGQSPSTPEKSDPNRHSRIPTFIPFNNEPGPSGYFADKDSDIQTPTSVKSPPTSPAKNEKTKKKKINGGRKLFKKKHSKKDKEDEKTRVSRGPTFFPFTIEEDSALDTTKRKKSKEEKTRKRKSKKQDDSLPPNQKCHISQLEQKTVSMDSLEWDPSYSLSDSSSSPVEELTSPVPPMKPSPFALKTIQQARQSSSSYGSAGRGSGYSMEWDPTGVQPRVNTPQCEWEPYAVEETGSSSSSNGVNNTLRSSRRQIETANVAAV